jgi:hypothetical protein
MLYGTAKEATDSYFEGKGSSSPAGKYSNKNKEYRALGFSREGCPFPNPWFPPDYRGDFTNDNDSILVPAYIGLHPGSSSILVDTRQKNIIFHYYLRF